MVSAPFAGFAALSAAFTAIDLFPFMKELLSRAGTATPPGAVPTLGGAVEVVLPLAATVVLLAVFTFIHLHLAGPAAQGAANRRLSELVTFALCGAAGTLLYCISVQRGGVIDDAVSVLARALGSAALEALPATAAVVFFLGISLVIAHIRAGGEGGGGPVGVDVMKKIALGAAAALLCQISVAAFYVNN